MKLTESLIKLLHKADDGERIVCFMMPTCMIRVVVCDDNWLRFRVQQCIVTNRDPNNLLGSWRTLSSHQGDLPGESYKAACMAAVEADNRMLAKFHKQHQQRVRAHV